MLNFYGGFFYINWR